jgi:hypothetical protein
MEPVNFKYSDRQDCYSDCVCGKLISSTQVLLSEGYDAGQVNDTRRYLFGSSSAASNELLRRKFLGAHASLAFSSAYLNTPNIIGPRIGTSSYL